MLNSCQKAGKNLILMTSFGCCSNFFWNIKRSYPKRLAVNVKHIFLGFIAIGVESTGAPTNTRRKVKLLAVGAKQSAQIGAVEITYNKNICLVNTCIDNEFEIALNIEASGKCHNFNNLFLYLCIHVTTPTASADP